MKPGSTEAAVTSVLQLTELIGFEKEKSFPSYRCDSNVSTAVSLPVTNSNNSISDRLFFKLTKYTIGEINYVA